MLNSRVAFAFLTFVCIPVGSTLWAAEAERSLRVHVSWGHSTAIDSPFTVGLRGENVAIGDVRAESLESGDECAPSACRSRAGGGDVDGLSFVLRYVDAEIREVEKLNSIWRDLIAAADADTAQRLRLDPGYRHDSRKLTLLLDSAGTRGFSVTVDQLLRQGTFWVPALDVYLSTGEQPVPFAEHRRQLEPLRGRRILEQVSREPEATLEQFRALWEDMGSPAYRHPSQAAPGHVIGLSWDSAIPKFGVDRGSGVWNDYGNPDRFRFWFDFAEIGPRLAETWKGQSLQDGLPVVTTRFESDGVRYEVEQFAYPLHGPPRRRRGDIAMVLMQKLRCINLGDHSRKLVLGMTHRREHPAVADFPLAIAQGPEGVVLEDSRSQGALVSLQADGPGEIALEVRSEAPAADAKKKGNPAKVARLKFAIELPSRGTREVVVKLPSPVVIAAERGALMELDYGATRDATLRFWSDYVARGAQFEVPEKAVNDLFRANLWHALRLPRRHGGEGPDVKIDLPYSNFAYDQQGTPWPVNQAVYVDYMIYDLRGYHAESLEELLAIYRNNQQADGRVGGFANWGVYTPSMIYASAKHFLLSQDRGAFDRLLPPTLKALDYCLAEIARTSGEAGPGRGLVRAPLNDLSGEGVWAFNQAYSFAGAGYAWHCTCAARPSSSGGMPGGCAVVSSVGRRRNGGGERAAAPLVQLRDHTWSPYVPGDVAVPRRRFDHWYPTDVDTGPVHLLRLEALAPRGRLADYLLNDHEDNLFYRGRGMANEPVYNQQATAYLLRDDVKAVIRAFYSYVASAFSHSALEPVEHRWTWGQYFGPPSTDGAWFDLYRHMLVREAGDDLLLFQATPRKWLAQRGAITIARAPTCFGKLSAGIESHADESRIQARIDLGSFTRMPKRLVIRFRHPRAAPMRSATVDGAEWPQFDRGAESLVIENPVAKRYDISIAY